MAFFAQFAQRVEQPAPKAGILFRVKPKLSGNPVGCFESDAPDIVRQTVRVFPDRLNALLAVGPEDPGCVRGAYIMLLKKEHDILDFLLLRPAGLNALHAEPADTRDRQQRFRVLFDHLKRFRPELPHDLFRKLGPDPFDQA